MMVNVLLRRNTGFRHHDLLRVVRTALLLILRTVIYLGNKLQQGRDSVLRRIVQDTVLIIIL